MIEIREKPRKVERAYIVALQTQIDSPEEINELLDELGELVKTLNITVIDRQVVKVSKIQAGYIVGTGKADEIIESCKEQKIDVVIFDESLSPSQQRNWEKRSSLCVIDRREIILDIFSERATTREAILQTGLARAAYDLPRLKRAWTHLHRQRGGIGGMKGEGEAQIEVDRRLVRKKIQKLEQELVKVRLQRETQRKKRLKKPVPNAALVGYTNAGKSSLLNSIAGSNVLADKKLFATLDPTTKRIVLPNSQEMLLTDTVGFIRKLPHDLVEAFKATLEEAVLADFLLHVVDSNQTNLDEYYQTTLDVLKELGAEKKRMLTVFNKIDLLDDEYTFSKLKRKYNDAFFISAKTGEGIPELIDEMNSIINENLNLVNLRIPFSRYDVIALLHRSASIVEQLDDDNFSKITANIPTALIPKIKEFVIE